MYVAIYSLELYYMTIDSNLMSVWYYVYEIYNIVCMKLQLRAIAPAVHVYTWHCMCTDITWHPSCMYYNCEYKSFNLWKFYVNFLQNLLNFTLKEEFLYITNKTVQSIKNLMEKYTIVIPDESSIGSCITACLITCGHAVGYRIPQSLSSCILVGSFILRYLLCMRQVK